ncbi:MAG TPA: hypothetical protein PKC03_03395, partial [Dokdonella sp.]|nr:hypothetical protein [Dokdonella sp.]
ADAPWPCFKPAQQRGARRQVSPDRLFQLKQVAFKRPANRTARLAKATSLHFATQHGWRAF